MENDGKGSKKGGKKGSKKGRKRSSTKDEEIEAEIAEEQALEQPPPEAAASADMGEERSLLISLLSQLRIGMDLSRVTLPTFILEPKSFLEKLTDFFTHPDLLLGSVDHEDPLERMKAITRWYMSGFYIRPKGVKKPYNPILGEIFRSSWDHPDSKSFYISEQVSHHPPVSAVYASNRPAGLVLNGSIHFRSKFMGNSTAAILDGEATLYVLHYDEEYVLSFPSAYARGILWGTLLMELGGNVYIKCKQTGLRAEIEFKTKGYFGGEYNAIAGKIIKQELDNDLEPVGKKKKIIYTLSGHWDKQLYLKDEKTKKSELFWDPYGGMAVPGMAMNIRPLEEQDPFESRRLWHQVTQALLANDQNAATDEKRKLEDAQRRAVKDREEQGVSYTPRLFHLDENGDWVYNYFNLEKWTKEQTEELEEYEEEGVIAIRKKSGGSSSSSSAAVDGASSNNSNSSGSKRGGKKSKNKHKKKEKAGERDENEAESGN